MGLLEKFGPKSELNPVRSGRPAGKSRVFSESSRMFDSHNGTYASIARQTSTNKGGVRKINRITGVPIGNMLNKHCHSMNAATAKTAPLGENKKEFKGLLSHLTK